MAEQARTLWLIAALIIVAAAAYFVIRQRGDRSDPLVAALVATPLPANSHENWRVDDKPEVTADAEAEPGQVARVMAHLGRSVDPSAAGFDFKVFKSFADASKSYAEATTYDQAHFPKLTPDELADFQKRVAIPTGITASCLALGPRAGSCHALANRTVIFVFMDGEPVEQAIAATRALVSHVTALDK